ncbi:transporter substrate-binding domain-containing protein [Brucella pseudintermedia]|uniref:transporter substrate-binding domain-containing protein n=1 Tax=Brucella pseudintermedia TaxID=370111 RepID=UPI00158CD94F|nr:transporter substrate-binding domain-containing protein [Brucella pseudintermedia]
MNFRIFFLLFAIVATTFIAQSATAQNDTISTQPLTIGLYVSPPFVMKDGDHYSGMAIELWEATAPLNLSYSYREYPTFEALIAAVQRGEAQVAVSNLTITKDRVERIAFSQPWYDAGLRIMIADSQGSGFWQILGGLEKAGHLRAMAWLVFIIVVATILLAVFYRRFDKDFPRRWHEGLAESFYEVMSVATSGKVTRANALGWIGRISGGIWMVCGVAVIAYVTSSVTSVMTALTLTHQINSLADLPGRSVGVLGGSVAESYSNDMRLATRPYGNIDSAVQSLVSGEVTAIIGDAPVLEYYAHTHASTPLSVVGAIFHPDKYGFGFRHGDTLSHDVTLEILALQEGGELERLRRKYFGDER